MKSWYLYDGHGSVRMLANGTGQTTDTWTYDAWGETTSRTGVTENDYLYAGERFDLNPQAKFLACGGCKFCAFFCRI